MGIIIHVIVDRAQSSASTPIEMVLKCDVASEMFCRGFEKFTGDAGFIGCHAAAIAKGWLERQGPRGRLWLCPECSGKITSSAAHAD